MIALACCPAAWAPQIPPSLCFCFLGTSLHLGQLSGNGLNLSERGEDDPPGAPGETSSRTLGAAGIAPLTA